MTESNQAPLLSLTPEAPDKELDEVVASIQEKPAAPAAQTAPKLDSSQLTPAERKAIDDFEKQIDVSNPDHILLFGADAQKKIADFSRQRRWPAVQHARTPARVGDMLVNLVDGDRRASSADCGGAQAACKEACSRTPRQADGVACRPRYDQGERQCGEHCQSCLEQSSGAVAQGRERCSTTCTIMNSQYFQGN